VSGTVQSDLDPIIVGNGSITSVSSFCYLGSLVESHGGVQLELMPGYLELPVHLGLSEICL